MDQLYTSPSAPPATRHPAAPRLAADLAKLRDRYLAAFPNAPLPIDALAHVPAALRHLLALPLELRRADTLPARYRNIAAHPATATTESVDRLVAAYAIAVRCDDPHAAHAAQAALRRYFTPPQIVELAVITCLARVGDSLRHALG